jgi:multiple sugar transport system permease protein
MDLLGWIDQPRALYIPGASAFGIFLMRQFHRQLGSPVT